MKVSNLIAELQKMNGESRVFMGYDGNMVVTEPFEVEQIENERAIGSCWYRVRVGDVVILSSE